MYKFKDAKDREFSFAVTVGEIIRVKSASEGRFDLFDPDNKVVVKVEHENKTEERTLRQIAFVEKMSDWEEFSKILWYLVEPQAESLEPKLSPLELMKAIPDKQLLDIARAFRKEWRDFFHQLGRLEQASTLDAASRYQTMAEDKLKEALATVDYQACDQEVAKTMDSIVSESFSDLPARLASTLSTLRGEN